MARSLLAHLYPHIRGSQEDVATLSLAYLLSSSDPLRIAFISILSSKLHVNVDEKTQFHTQASGENKERPDLAGIDSNGQENVLCEMKFYAALTDNQPNTYIDRLITGQGSGLVFICPNTRQIGLWQQLLTLCKKRILTPVDDTSAIVDGIPMAITNWTEVLDALHEIASDKDPGILDDLHQLRGFCDRMDANASLPFRPEDLGADVARSIDRYYIVVDQTIEQLRKQNKYELSTKGLRATPQWYGHTRYFRLGNFTCRLEHQRELWQHHSSLETPFWLLVSKDWKQTEELRAKMLALPEERRGVPSWSGWLIMLALVPKPYVTLDEVAADMSNQIIEYIDLLNHS